MIQITWLPGIREGRIVYDEISYRTYKLGEENMKFHVMIFFVSILINSSAKKSFTETVPEK